MARLPSAPDLMGKGGGTIAIPGAISGPSVPGVASAPPKVSLPDVSIPQIQISDAESRALMQVGDQVAKLGNVAFHVIQKEKEHSDAVRVEDAFNNLRDRQMDLTLGAENGFTKQVGGNAVNKPIVEDWTGKFNHTARQIEETLQNPEQIEKFKARAAIARQQFQGDMLRHVAQQTDVYARDVLKATFETELKNIGASPDDPLSAGLSFERVTAAVTAEGRRLGKSDEMITADVGKATDSLWASRLEAWRLKDPVGAMSSFQENQQTISPAMRVKLAESLYRDAAPVLAAQLNAAGGPPITATQLAKPSATATAPQTIAYEKTAADERVRLESMNGKPYPRGIRNNNPGNIVQSQTRWEGEIDGADPRFASFATPEAGIRALGRNLLAYEARGLNTVSSIIARWAPATENDTAAYVATVAKQIGVNPNEPLNLKDRKTMTSLATAIIRHENGVQPYDEKTIGAGVDSALTGQSFAYESRRTPAFQVASLSNLTATDALSIVTGNPVIDRLPPDQKIDVLHRAKTIANQGMSQARESLKGRYTDTVAAYTRGQDSPNPPTESELIMTFGQFDGAKMAGDLALARSFGNDVKSVQNRSATEQAALLAARTPVPGEGYAAAVQRHDALSKAIDTVQRGREQDPALSIMQNSAQVQTAYRSFIESLSGGDATQTQAAAKAYAVATLAEQQRLEIRNPQILTKDMVDSIAKRFAEPPKEGENVANIMRGMVDQWGKYWPAVSRQLGSKIPPEATVIGLGISPEAEGVLAEAAKLKPEQLRQGLEKDVVKDVQDRVRQQLEPLQKTLAWQSGGISTYDNFADSAEKIAISLVQRGMKPKEAAEKAFTGLAGFKYEFESTYRIPKSAIGASTSISSIRSGAEAIKRDVGSDNPVLGDKVALAIPMASPGVRPADAERQWRDTIVSNGFWVTSPGDGGLTLYVKSGLGAQPVLDAVGKPITRTWDQVSAVGNSTRAAFASDVYRIESGKRKP